MHFIALVLSLALLAPSADAAVIASTKQKQLPVIGSLRVRSNMEGMSFAVKKAPSFDAYDVWARLADPRDRVAAEWLLASMKFRTRDGGAVKKTSFDADLREILAYARGGTYELTVFVCPPNIRKPNAAACANASTAIDHRAETSAD